MSSLGFSFSGSSLLLFNFADYNLCTFLKYNTTSILSLITIHGEDSYFSIRKAGIKGKNGILVLIKAIKT